MTGRSRFRLHRAPTAFAGFVICLLVVLASANAQVPLPLPPSQPAPQVDIGQLTAEERAELLSRLSDQQVREMMLAYMAATASSSSQQTPVVDEIHRGITLFQQRFSERLSHIGGLAELPEFAYAKLAEDRSRYHPFLVLGLFAVIAAVALAAEQGYRRLAGGLYAGLTPPAEAEPLQRLGRLIGRLFLDTAGVAVFAVVILGCFLLLHHDHEPTRMVVMTLLTALVITRLISVVSRFFFAPFAPRLRIAPFDDETAQRIHRWVMLATYVATFGLFACGLMLDLGQPPTEHDLLLDMLSIVMVGVLAAGAFRLRRPIAFSVAARIEDDGRPRPLLRRLASLWYVAFIVYILFLYLLSTYKSVLGQETAAYPGLISLTVILLVPAADFFLRSLLDHAFPAAPNEAGRAATQALPVFKRALRILLVIFAFYLIGRVWGVDFFTLGQAGLGVGLMRAVIDISLVLLVAYVAWGATKAALARYLTAEDEGDAVGGDEGGGASASRLETIIPLVLRFVQITLIVIVALIVLSSLGVDIGPLLAGAGVVGIAVGFGAQTLVRDVVSGLFFLMDDAFRKGEYVDIGSVKGTVERINVRSLVLRHHLGPLHTVPFGEIQHLTNFSRDWVIMKMEFRVPTDTDITKVKKIFKQVGAEMLEHPDLAGDFIEPFKSQGIKSIEDSAIIVRGKFMSRPGRQFVLRKELFNRVQKAFQENGIAFAHRKVTVELPPDLQLSPEQKKQLAESAGAAAIAAEEGEQESDAVPSRA